MTLTPPLAFLLAVVSSSMPTADAEPSEVGRQKAGTPSAVAQTSLVIQSSTRKHEAGPGQQLVVVSVPRVIFEQAVVVRHGLLRSRVLLTSPGVSAIVALQIGSTSHCPTALEAGRVTAFSCPIGMGTQRLDIVVRTDDGHRYSHVVSGR